MTPQIPVEDPSSQDSLVDLTAAYIRQNVILKVLLSITVFDHLAAITLVLLGRLRLIEAGVLVLFSVLSWFFAVAMPVMNRAIREQVGARATSYWGEVVEMFGRVALFVVTGLYTYMLVVATFSPIR